jgi:polar amino acid transport system substrate-binding protein
MEALGMARRMRAIVLAAGAMVLGPLGAAAEDATVSFVTGNNYQPFADENLPRGGMVTAMVRAAYKTVPAEISTIRFTDWKRGYNAVKNGKYTATFPYVKTRKRKKEMLYSDPIYTTKTYAATKAALPYEIDKLADLHGLTYCTPMNYSPGSKILELERAGKLEAEHPYRMKDCVRMLRTERVDFIPSERPPVIAAAKETFGSADPIEFEDAVLQRTTLHAIFGKDVAGSKAAMRTFNTALQQLRESGEWQAIVNRYMD